MSHEEPRSERPVRFDADLALRRQTHDGGDESGLDPHTVSWTGSFSDRWFIDRSLHGGHVIAAMARACEATVGDAARQLRSLTHHYVAPAMAGDYTVHVRVERAGRTLTNVSARLEQDGRLVGCSLAALGTQWESTEWDHTRMPEVAPAEQCPDLWEGSGGFTNLHRQWRYWKALGPGFGQALRSGGSAGDTPVVGGGWLLLAEPRPVDAALAACLTDTWPPMALAFGSEQRMLFPTIELTVQLLAPLPLPHDDGARPCLVWHRIDTSAGGYAIQDTEVWTEAGRLIARGRQHALFVPART